MAAPTLMVRIDWNADGAFDQAIDSMAGRVQGGASWKRGRSADFGTEATGSAALVLENRDDFFTPDRNWCDNPSFEAGVAGWSTTAIASLVAAATSISQVTDNATPATGSKAGEAVLTGTLNSGVSYAIPYKFRSGVTYAVSVHLKSISGTLSVRAGLASAGTPADIASSGADITTSWAAYAFTWTPSADRTDAVLFLRTTAAAAATLRIDAVQVNPGATANAYLEAPTKGQLVPGRPVHIHATYSATDYPQFYGYIERITPRPADRTVEITCYDVLRRLDEQDVVVAAHSFVVRSARDFRREVLEDFERGSLNCLSNPAFAVDTTGWSGSGTLTRITADAPPGAVACGQWVTTAAGQNVQASAYLSGFYHPGQVYRISAYVKLGSGEATVKFGGDYNAAPIQKTVVLTTSWQRVSTTYTIPGTTFPVGQIALVVSLTAIGVGTVLFGNVSVTRGQALVPYADIGAGRWANWCANGSFDGGALNGWYDGWTNGVSNPSFETNTAGWVLTANSFHTVGTSITRVVGASAYGAARADVAAAVGGGAHTVLSGIFKSGVTYRAMLSVWVGAGTANAKIGIGSNGTPTDKAELSFLATTGADSRGVTWTPSADRTDVHLYVVNSDGSTLRIDGAAVFRRDAASALDPLYSDIGPGGGGTFVATRAISTTAKYGSRSQEITTPATARAGRVYDFKHAGNYFVAGQPYTLSIWLTPTSGMPYQVGMGANKNDGTWDEVTVTGTAPAGVPTQVTVTWTPTSNRSAYTSGAWMGTVVAHVYQTDATARTVLIDGVRVIPGSTADDFEMPQWNLAAENDTYQTAAALSGSALSALGTLNGLTLSRHWITPMMTSPFYQYGSSSRDDVAASAETFNDDVADVSGLEIDRASIVNVVPVVHSVGTYYYSDADSVNHYGPRPSGAIGNANFLSAATADIIGPALISRGKDPRARPQITIINRWPSQLTRQLGDIITLTFARQRIYSQRYSILSLETSVSRSAQEWTTRYILEEMP